MKKIVFFFAVWAVLLISGISTVHSQPINNFEFSEAGVVFSIPENWDVSREHVLLLLMPKAEDLIIETLLSENEFDEVIQESIDKIRLLFPEDTNIIRKDIRQEKFVITELTLEKDKNVINYFIVKTPKDKVFRMYFLGDKAVINKYKPDINYIRQNIREMD